MRITICAVAALAFASSAALAHAAPPEKDAPNASAATKAPSRTVYICDESRITRRGFAREFGSAEFVKAEAALRRDGDRWSAPKCITAAEARRLKQLASAR